MTDPPATRSDSVTVVADDLSGAAEAASVFLGHTRDLSLRLDGTTEPRHSGVTVVDLNSRTMSETDAQTALRRALTELEPGAILVKKIDSLLRGHIGAEVTVLADRGPVIIAGGLPALNRTVKNGTLYLSGVPLHESQAWTAETLRPPRSIAELFGDHPTAAIPAGLHSAEFLANAATSESLLICDVTTDADLDVIVAASRAIPGAQLVGTAALAAAVARTLPTVRHEPQTPSAELVLTVVGTAEASAAEQVRALVADGTLHITYAIEDLLAGTSDPATLTDALQHGSVVVTVAGVLEPIHSRSLSATLGRLVAAGERQHRPDLVLTGGETARAVVDAIGFTSLRPVHEVHHGAVVSVASDGRRVVTRPGSFGDTDSLTAITKYLLNGSTQPQ